jgi:hypothetical protein
LLQLVGNRHAAGCDGSPEHGVARRGLVAPAFSALESYRKIVDRRWRTMTLDAEP